MKIALFGYGKMGKCVERIALSEGHEISTVEEADVAIDFSHPDALFSHVKLAVSHSLPLIIGTTGWEQNFDEIRQWVKKHEGAALYAPNFSLGMHLFIQVLKKARELLAPFPEYAIAGLEWHHSEKKDAPSGTAKQIESELNMPSPFTSVRLGSMPGRHEVIFDSPSETLTFSHEARGRMGFAGGAIQAAKWILNRKGWFTLDDMFRSLYSHDHSL
ncbi:MAG: dihydrodipicolinate reductase C-terminal domain-containing protein [Chlamydiales bacterium]